MARITGVIVGSGDGGGSLDRLDRGGCAAPPAAKSTVELPREIPGGVELALADGDGLRL